MKKSSKTYFILILFLFIFLFPFILLHSYNHPSADDYSYSINSDQELQNQNQDSLSKLKTIIISQAKIYNNWSNRYFSNLIVSLNPIVFDSFLGYKIGTFLIFSLFLASFWFFLYVVNDCFFGVENLKVFYFYVFMIFSLLYSFPSPVEGFFWYTGAVSYILPISMLLMFSALFLKMLYRVTPKYMSWLSLLVICIIGSNESIMMLIDLVLLALTVVFFVKNHRFKNHVMALMVIAILCSSVVVFAPGNAVRASYLPKDKNILNMLQVIIEASIGYSLRWSLLSPLILVSIVLIPIFNSMIAKTNQKVFIKPQWILLGMVGMNAFLTFPSVWCYQNSPPPRIINFVYFIFVLGWFYFIFNLLGQLKNKGQCYLIPKLIIGSIVMALFVSGLESQDSNYFKLYHDITSGSASLYDKQLNERYKIMKLSDSMEVAVPPLTYKPYALYFADVESDASDWKNQSFAKYFKKDKIYLKEY
jgi:hypothetical protein